MTKKELLNQIRELENKNCVKIEGCNESKNKKQLEKYLLCISCSDEVLDKYFCIIELKYPNIAREIKKCENWKTHSFHRFYIFNTANLILGV